MTGKGSNKQPSNYRQEDTFVYGLSPRVLDSLQLMYFDSDTTQEISPISKEESPAPRALSPSLKDREYYKSDLHRLNLKRQERGLPELTEEEFEELADGLESISGSEASDSEDEEVSKDYRSKSAALDTIFEKSIQKLEQLQMEESSGVVSHLATRSPFILFKSDLLPEEKCFGIYKSIFSIKDIEDPIDALKRWQTTGKSKKSALFMIGGGHFAGAIVSHLPRSTKGNTVKPGENILDQSVDFIVNKTMHKYTTRRKQGGSQSAMDNAKGKANSAGSNLRRANEAALQNEVRDLLRQWKGHLDDCESIFIRATGAQSRAILIGYEGAVLKSNDPRIRAFPFTTKRATAGELKRAWVNLTYLSVTDKPKIDEKKSKLKQQQEQLKQSTLQKEKKMVEESPEVKHTKEIVGYLKKARGPVLMTYMKKNKLSGDFKLQPESEYYNTPTILHYAAAHGIKGLIPVIVKTLKADLTGQNANGRTAYDVSANKATRQSFQMLRHELGESAQDWPATHIGPAISREEVEKAEQEAKDREDQEKKDLIEQELKKDTPVVKGPKQKLGGVSTAQANLSTLTEEQRRRVMREQMARAAEARLKAMQGK
ncbi:CYFA0S01e15610g1_1 [Cyberlindnera fabianii]|uniref:CYFA0S01e15610g1_1 n=1 Tax=Cyberlindnera fabianii TaxID=36022 RepID=A0A061AKQ0_CYBFA|nr:CYFA0S01e15610g1_1 [Cyberlindnera fabianii]